MRSTTCERNVRLDDEVTKPYCGSHLVAPTAATRDTEACAALRAIRCDRLTDTDRRVRKDQCE